VSMTHGYVHFVCPSQPTAEWRSYGRPNTCPCCRTFNPIKADAFKLACLENDKAALTGKWVF
jgi:hypothetical protein